jgi:hypothetical protein
MSPLKEKLFEIQIEELLLMSYNISKSWLQVASLYLQRVEAHDMLARGSENSFVLHHTAGRPPDANLLYAQFHITLNMEELKQDKTQKPKHSRKWFKLQMIFSWYLLPV